MDPKDDIDVMYTHYTKDHTKSYTVIIFHQYLTNMTGICNVPWHSDSSFGDILLTLVRGKKWFS